MMVRDSRTGQEIEAKDFVAVYVCVVVKDPGDSSAVALVGVEQVRATELPEDQPISQPWNMEIAKPIMYVDGLQYISGETPDSVLMRAASALDHDALFLVGDKNMIVGIDDIGPDPVVDLPIEHHVDMVLTGGRTMTYDDTDGVYMVPIRDIVTALITTHGRGALSINTGLELEEGLSQELLSLHMGQEELDTMLLAVGMAVWKINMEYKREVMFLDDRAVEDDPTTWGLPR